ncbi:MAG: PilZ domain-containing protein [Alphaproteobacteria bacterium]|uniref:PilZ domain-containing protein n=1 Tax=Hyphomonas sp. TaxID=87 RepID=UPI001DA52CCF|nr:PilZ domain-containing protein [Alphaproteobacteria bacterium]MBU2082808.1 PilZ domain-containing protein [Alphaproteobacteria bacterium]MBU2142900.1 PilZ domain-containing protein [Alphaproteobacteria bacterium]MBU2197931.1 PilZ domain-containing protein [Alphaproteobacteria bacterium]
MTVPHVSAVSSHTLINPNKDRRLHKRITLRLFGRVLDETSADHDVQTVDISCSGAMIRSAHRPLPGAQVICYFNDLGRVAATVIRSGPQGFAVHFQTLEHKRDKLADRLTWLLNKDRLSLVDERVATRVATSGPAVLTLGDGSEIGCRVLDISLTGASFEAEKDVPMVGDIVIIGNVRGEVVRVEQKVFAIRYKRTGEI